MLVELSFKTSHTVSTSIRPNLFKRDCLLFVIPRGRRSDKKSETTDGEKRQLRAVWGSINWVQREGHRDVFTWHGITQSQYCARFV